MTVVDIANGIQTIQNAAADKLVSQEKKLSYVAQYISKALQNEYYGNLLKDGAISVKKTDDYELMYGSNDFVTLDYQVAITDPNWDTRYALALDLSAVTCVAKHERVEVKSTTCGYSKKLDFNKTEIFNTRVNATENLTLLPNGAYKTALTPSFNGVYNFWGSAGTTMELYEWNEDDSLTLLAESVYDQERPTIYQHSLQTDKRYLLYSKFTNTKELRERIPNMRV